MFNLFKKNTKKLKTLQDDRDMLYDRVVRVTEELQNEKNYSAMLKKQLDIINKKSRSITELIEDGHCEDMEDKEETSSLDLVAEFEDQLNAHPNMSLTGSCIVREDGKEVVKRFNRKEALELLENFKSGELELIR